MLGSDFLNVYYGFISNSDYQSMQDFWSSSSPFKLYIGESHKNVFERFKIRCDVLSAEVVYRDESCMIIKDKVNYQAVIGDGFADNNTTSLWVVSLKEKLLISNATIDVEFV
ncbi:hypothetical protein [Shewanella sp. 30m-9]